MLSLMRDTQLDKAKKTLREVMTYAEDVARDQRLRADIRAAAAHGTKASERVKKDIDAGGITSRLADDKKLRRNLRAMLDDLESAGERVRGKRRHRVRNALLMAGAALALFTVAVKARDWISGSEPEEISYGESEVAPTV